MRNTGLKNSNYCMTVVGVAPPLHVSCKKCIRWQYSLYNGSELQKSYQGHFVSILACETIVKMDGQMISQSLTTIASEVRLAAWIISSIWSSLLLNVGIIGKLLIMRTTVYSFICVILKLYYGACTHKCPN